MKQIVCRDIHGKEYKVSSDELEFRPSVYGLLIKDDKILLFPEDKNGYDFPGGGMEIYEKVEDCLKREFWEETGLEVEPVALVDVQSSFFKFRSSDKYANSILIYYVCRQTGGSLSKDNLDENEKINGGLAEWIKISDIDNIKFYNSIDSPALIKKALEIKNK